MKTTIYRRRVLSTILLFSLFAFISCDREEMKYPKPAENPVRLTAEAQTKELHIKYFFGISPLNKTDEVTYEDKYEIIKADWISYMQWGDLPEDVLKIEVAENTSSQPRSHTIKVSYKINSIMLTVTQAGKP